MTSDIETSATTRVVYILGSQRGGTTILGRVLGTIEGMAYAGELRDLWATRPKLELRCGCGKRHAECEIWSELHARLDTRLVELVRLGRQVMPPRHSWWPATRFLKSDAPFDPRSAAGRYVRLIGDVYREYADLSGAGVVIDSSKHPGDAALLARAPGVSLVCVQIVRDPRGVVFDGELRRSRRRGRLHERAAWGHPEHVHPFGAIRGSLAWVARHHATEAVRRAAGRDRGLLIRYEDFCANPAQTLTAVSRLTGHPSDRPPPSSDGTFYLPTAHTPAGNGRRRAADVVLVEDERWKVELPMLDRVLATVLSTPGRHRYGYRVSVSTSQR